jgi:hypothetical protein
MRKSSLLLPIGFVVLFAAQTIYGDQTYSNVAVSAKAEISGAGNAGLPDSGGIVPVLNNLPASPSVLTISSVTGTVTLNNGGGRNDADGVVTTGSYGLTIPGASLMTASGGLSGIKGPGAGYLVGVFETSAGPSGTVPASLDFVPSDPGGIATTFTSLSPLLNQVFYIGDGRTGDGTGTTQQFLVPAGATRLFLGISDADNFSGGPSAYSDNADSFTASFTVTTVPEPASAVLYGLGAVIILLQVRRPIRGRSQRFATHTHRKT